MKINNRNVELLAPAGTYESLVAGIQSGADAVYLAGKNFGARTYAGNFDNEEIIRAIQYAHLRGKKIYVVVNTLIKDKETKDCLEFVKFLYKNDVDALIIQDIGIAAIIKTLFPDLELHSSTQMSVANSLDVLHLKGNGFSRAVLARENSLEDIRYIKERTGMELEVFAHGALCVSYSGKCLFSYINGGRSGNRGECAQPCRKKYNYNFNGKNENNYLLSTKDLSTINDIKSLILSGVDSFKIEGRMKKPEYVSAVVKSYREAIDAAVYNKDVDMEKINYNLANTFNRTFTKGLVLNELPKNLVNKSNSKNIGTEIGEIIAKNKTKIKIKLTGSVQKGDGLDLGENIGRIFLNGNIVNSAQKDDIIELDYIGNAKVGDIIKKTSDKNLADSVSNILKNENVKIPIDFYFEAKIGQKPILTMIDDDNNIVKYIGDEIVEQSQKSPLNTELVREQFSKTQDTIFVARNLDFKMDSNAFLRKSSLNAIRRNALSMLEELRKNHYKREFKETEIQVSNIYKLNQKENTKDIYLSVKCLQKNQIEVCKKLEVNSVYVDNVENYLYAKKLDIKTFFSTPIVMRDYQIKELLKFIDEENPNILTNSIGFAKHMSNKYTEKSLDREIRIDYLANVYNKFAIEYLYNQKINSFNLSLEHELFSFVEGSYISGFEDKIELPLYIHPMLMFTEYCPYKTNIECKECSINNKRIVSEDKQNKAILKKDAFCRMEFLDEKVLDFRQDFSKFKNLGINKFRVDLLNENKEEVEKIIKNIRK